MTSPTVRRSAAMASSASASAVNRVRLMTATGDATLRPASQDATPRVLVPRSSPSRGPSGRLAAAEEKASSMKLVWLALALLASGAAHAQSPVARAEAEARAAGWAYAFWQARVAALAPEMGVPAPAVRTRYATGSAPGALNLLGSAEPGLVTLHLEGTGWGDRSEKAEGVLARNAAHEVAHLVQYATGPAERDPLWLHEGFAEAIARDAVLARGEAAPGGAEARCAAVLKQGPVRRAFRRGDNNAYYDCGALVVRAVAAARGEGAAELYRAFAAAGRTEAAFLSLAEEVDLRRSVEAFLRTDYAAAKPSWVYAQLREGRL